MFTLGVWRQKSLCVALNFLLSDFQRTPWPPSFTVYSHQLYERFEGSVQEWGIQEPLIPIALSVIGMAGASGWVSLAKSCHHFLCTSWYRDVGKYRAKIFFSLCALLFGHGCQVPWNWNYRELWTAVWVLGIEPRSSGRAVSALNCWAISPAQGICFL